MRRIVAIALVLIAAGLVIAWPARGGDGGPYLVRAIFDNGSFVVAGEEVRIAGATVGTVESVDVSREDEIVSLEDGPHAVPGKAVIVLKIDDDGFKDFRQDASCIIRPQSLIGERFIDCKPTEPRAPGTEPPPELERIEGDQPGDGEYLLPLENTGKAVDLDLVQNIMRYPYRERFRLILNELGASLAGRGDDLGDVIDRANPALRQTDRVLAILAKQNRQLAELAVNGDTILEPLARERQSLAGFITNAAVAGQATAERSAELEEGLRKLPATLREVRSTMRELEAFGAEGTPLFADLRAMAPYLNLATRKLGPFATAAIPALESLGDAGDETGPLLVEADDLVLDLRSLGRQVNPASKALKKALNTLALTNGFKHIANAIYNLSGTLNGYDSLGHLLRTNLLVTACVEYQAVPAPGCIARWGGVVTGAAAVADAAGKALRKAGLGPGVAAPDSPGTVEELPEIAPTEPEQTTPEQTTPDQGGGEETTTTPETTGETVPEATAGASLASGRATAPLRRTTLRARRAALLLRFLLGSGS